MGEKVRPSVSECEKLIGHCFVKRGGTYQSPAHGDARTCEHCGFSERYYVVGSWKPDSERSAK